MVMSGRHDRSHAVLFIFFRSWTTTARFFYTFVEMMQIKAKFAKKNAGLYLFCVASFHLCLQDDISNQHVVDRRIIESVFNSHRLRITFVAAAFCFPLYMLETRSKPHINVTKSAQLRLVGGHDSRSGTVVLEQDGKEGLVCSPWFNQREAKVVCDMLGYTNASPIGYKWNHFDTPETRHLPYLLGSLQCTGQETDIWDCRSGSISKYCYPGSNWEAGVSCVAPPSPPTHTYTFHRERLTPDAARASCIRLGGRLAQPKTRAQWSALMEVRYRGGYLLMNTWMDLRRSPTGMWQWGDGEQLQWANWARGQPGGGNCVHMLYGEWYTRRCYLTFLYMCEADI